MPAILDDTVRLNAFSPGILRAMTALRDELTGGTLRLLREDAPDRAAWDLAALPFVGRSWLDLPWYFAEAYFYRRLLEATGWFQPGPGLHVDPFRPAKRQEEAADQAPRLVDELLARGPDPTGLLHGALWGNRVDLSYTVAKGLAGRGDDEAANLLVDDTARALAHLTATAGEVVVIADNAGTELGMDLALADGLLAAGRERVTLLLKGHPFFVSDALPDDVHHLVRALAAAGRPHAGALAARLQGHMDAGRLKLETHAFTTSSRHYNDMPQDLRARLAPAALVIVKGDANYRRLCQDAHWPRTTPFDVVTAGFPAPLLALRTLKAELAVGLPAGLPERLDVEAPGWMVDGRRGVIQAAL